MGCQSGTVGQILIGSNGDYKLNYVAGDGTVPIISASNIKGTQNYYVLDTDELTWHHAYPRWHKAAG